MKKIKRTFFIEEKGLTLVEVLASIVILSIVLIIFLSIFIQTAKTNKTSEEIVDATYIAQTEMEKFYGYSRIIKKSERINILQTESYGYSYEAEEEKEIYKINEDNYEVKITLSVEEDLTNILVKVFDTSEETSPSAQMQNLVEWWEGDANE